MSLKELLSLEIIENIVNLSELKDCWKYVLLLGSLYLSSK